MSDEAGGQAAEGQEAKGDVSSDKNVDQSDLQRQISEMQAGFKDQMAGLHRKITELTEKNKALEQAKDQTQQTAEQQIQSLRAQYEQDKADSALREKRLRWESEATKAGLPGEYATSMDRSLSIEDGIAQIKSLSDSNAERIKAEVNKALSESSYKPGSSGDTDSGDKKIDVNKLNNLSFKEMQNLSDKELAALYGAAE